MNPQRNAKESADSTPELARARAQHERLPTTNMQITVAQGAAKHQLSVEGEETVRAVKARLEELCSIPSAQQKLLVKGKEAADARRADPEPYTRSRNLASHRDT